MKKILSWIWDNVLFLESLFLLAFIPLYPKLPLVDVKNTWVYIRVEDFIVLFVLLSWLALLVKKKITLKTPLTLPILIFWLIGAIATVHGVLLVFPTLANVFPNVAFLSLIRHIEYMSLFFIGFHGMKDKRLLPFSIAVIVATLLGVIGYGFGQKYLGFPAYLTMNEEFAKGIPIQLSALSRVPSTFAGHYDLAAYLVLIIPIVVSLFFGFKNWLIRIFLLITSFLGFILLFMTVSRVSFFVLFIALGVVFFFQKRKIILFSIPLIAIAAVIFISFYPSLLNRFQSTVSEVDVLVDAKTGESIGHVKFVPAEYFKDKTVLQRRVRDRAELIDVVAGRDDKDKATSSAIFPFELIPAEAPLVEAVNFSTGESLSQGTGYINLSLSPVVKKVGNFFYELPEDIKLATISAQVLVLHGDFIIKRAAAYDISFTTRFQGEWPRALAAFQKNVLIGSGYGSVSLAVDNNYFRMLGEIGILGFASFFVIFLSLGIYIKKIFPSIDSKLAKSFILGFCAGVVGLALNATLIDVFEASKIAFLLWILFGITLAVVTLYQKKEINLLEELKKVAVSTPAVFVYLLFLTILLFSQMLGNFFVGDDFTWLRWASDCSSDCSPLSVITRYFTDSDGFFFRPGTKTYFYLMHQVFWLNQFVYHAVSLVLHFVAVSLFYILAKKTFKNNLLAVLSALLFLVMSGYSEEIFWISSTGHLFNAVFALLSLLFFIEWEEKKKFYYYVLSFVSVALGLLFHELGVVVPLLIIAFKLKDEPLSSVKNLFKRADYLLLYVPVVGYLVMRYLAQSHWLNGDYNYDLLKLPFNLVGNIWGYVSLTYLGPIALPFYQILRSVLREHILISVVMAPIAIVLLYFLYKVFISVFNKTEKKILLFATLFFVIALLPFLGLGNITSRYSYLAAPGLILIFVVFLKKAYGYLLPSGKNIAIIVPAIFIIVFSFFHIIQVQQAYYDWHGAGEKTRRFLISIDALYADYWSKGEAELHFVDVPLKVGEAWVFPVGLEDALWFSFKNKDVKVFTYNDLNTALGRAGLSLTNRVFKFNPDGSVTEVNRFKRAPELIIPK